MRSQSPDSATCSKRESTAPSGLCSVTSASAMSAVPPTSTPFCHSNHTATSPRPACGATADGGNNRAATARSTASRSADRRQSPVNSPPTIGVVGDERLRRQLDVLGELRRRERARFERQHVVVAAQAAGDVLEVPGDAARGVEIQHAAVAYQHFDVLRQTHRRLLARRLRRALQSVAVLVVDQRELRAVEREPVGAELAARRQPEQQIDRFESDARAASRQKRRGIAGRAHANVAERELGPAPSPCGIELRVVELEAELGGHPRLDLVLVVRQLTDEHLEPADREHDEQHAAEQRVAA